MNFSEVEVKVREATDPEESWGPTGQQMNDLAQATFSYEDFAPLMGMLWKRILKESNEGKNWRRIYKVCLSMAVLASSSLNMHRVSWFWPISCGPAPSVWSSPPACISAIFEVLRNLSSLTPRARIKASMVRLVVYVMLRMVVILAFEPYFSRC